VERPGQPVPCAIVEEPHPHVVEVMQAAVHLDGEQVDADEVRLVAAEPDGLARVGHLHLARAVGVTARVPVPPAHVADVCRSTLAKRKARRLHLHANPARHLRLHLGRRRARGRSSCHT